MGSPDKSFDQQMVSDHTQASTELQKLAQRTGITLPTEPAARHKATMQALEALSGHAFDKAYLESQEMDHDRTIALLEKQMRGTGDSDATALATWLLPVVQQHRLMVDRLDAGGTANPDGAAARPGGRGEMDHDRTQPRPGSSNSNTGHSTVTPSADGPR